VARLLDAFTIDYPELSLTDCASAASLNKSSAYRLLMSLERVGLVERNELLWRLGRKTVDLASVRLARLELRREVLPFLRELRREFRAAVTFGIPEGASMIFVERLDSPDDAHGVTVRLPIRSPIWTGAAGKAVLSRLDPAHWERMFEGDEWRRLPRPLRDNTLAEIEQAGARGYSVDRGDFFVGIKAVAVAFVDTTGEPTAALSVVMPGERMTEHYESVIGKQLIALRDDLTEAISFPLPLASR